MDYLDTPKVTQNKVSVGVHFNSKVYIINWGTVNLGSCASEALPSTVYFLEVRKKERSHKKNIKIVNLTQRDAVCWIAQMNYHSTSSGWWLGLLDLSQTVIDFRKHFRKHFFHRICFLSVRNVLSIFKLTVQFKFKFYNPVGLDCQV